jgi:ribosomal protein S20
MAAVNLATKQKQERKLDEIESMLKTLIHQVEYSITSYSRKDVEALKAAYRAVNAVTLLSDAELEQVNA